MSEVKKPTGYWTYDRCSKEALKYNTRNDFQKGNGPAYKSAQRNGWIDEICSHMTHVRALKSTWSKENCAREAKKHKNRNSFRKESGGAYNAARKNKWLDEICAHMEPPKTWKKK